MQMSSPIHQQFYVSNFLGGENVLFFFFYQTGKRSREMYDFPEWEIFFVFVNHCRSVFSSTFTQLRREDWRKREAEKGEEEAKEKKKKKKNYPEGGVSIAVHSHKNTHRQKHQKYSGENLLDSIKLNSILIIVGAGRLGPARRGSCDLCTRLTMKSGNNSCWMAGELMYLDAQVLSVTFPLINEHLLSIFGYTASPACLIWIADFWPPPR